MKGGKRNGLAVLLIAAVMHWHGLLTTKYKLK